MLVTVVRIETTTGDFSIAGNRKHSSRHRMGDEVPSDMAAGNAGTRCNSRRGSSSRKEEPAVKYVCVYRIVVGHTRERPDNGKLSRLILKIVELNYSERRGVGVTTVGRANLRTRGTL